MPRLHALELLPDEAGRDAVRRDWQALRDAGLPSQLDHTGGTNDPHLTAVAASAIDAGHEQLAAAALSNLLPVEVRGAAIGVLGGARVSLVRLVDVPDALVRAVLDLRAAVPKAQHPGWLPHITLARRLPRAEVARALDVLGHDDVVLRLTELRRWDPDTGTVHTVATTDSPED